LRELLSKVVASKGTSFGIFVALLAFLVVALMNALLKMAREGMPTMEVVFLRYLIGSLVLFCLVGRQPFRSLVPKGSTKFHFSRAILGTIAITCYTYSAKYLKLGDFTALSYTNPLFLAILASIFLKEQIPKVRWFAIALGFIGVLLIAQPERGGVSIAAVVLLFGCLSAASSDIFVRILTRRQSSSSIVLVFFTIAWIMVLPVMPFIWKNPTPVFWCLLIALGFISALGHTLFTKGLQLLPASLFSPFSYTSLIWTMIFAFCVWGDIPTARGIFGTLFIIADGCLAVISARGSLKQNGLEVYKNTKSVQLVDKTN
jgi:drug/metabolite transporter (DMT)-like permease